MDDDRSDDAWLECSKVRDILKRQLDETDYRIYKELNRDGRISDTELGERVGLSRTAARRRRQNLQEDGVMDVLAVLVLQEVDLAYADVFVTFSADAASDTLASFVNEMLEEELIYEVDEYMGEYDLLLRVWHASLSDVKRYVRTTLQRREAVADFDVAPVTKTHKAWHRIVERYDADD